MFACILDELGENSVPEGYLVVDSEVALLRGLLEAAEPLCVRGADLCRWAEEVCRGRGWRCQRLLSPTRELADDAPELAQHVARQLVEMVGPALVQLRRPLRAIDVAAALLPECDCWLAAPGTLHAAHWLVWASLHACESPAVDLVRAVCRLWRAECPALGTAYSGSTGDTAWETLKEYLRVKKPTAVWPRLSAFECPDTVATRLRTEWKQAAIETDGHFVGELIELGASPELLKLAVAVTVDYLRSNPHQGDVRLLETISRYVSDEDYWNLRKYLPPTDPGYPPEGPNEVVDWYRHRYIAFQEWSQRFGAFEQQARVQDIARRFGEWYLRTFVQARSGGTAAELLSWGRSARLARDQGSKMTLLVVLDGLCYQDALRFLSLVCQDSDRLSVEAVDAVFVPLPTTTDFGKPALLKGVDPAHARLKERELGVVCRDESEVIHALSNSPIGSLAIWTLVEPDKTYHWAGNVATEVDLRLQALAKRLVDVCHAVPPERKLKVVVSSDHGRLRTSARRTHPIPSGMVAHGRAAWGESNVVFGAEGFVIEGDIAFLHPERFAIGEVAAVLLDGDAFVTSDGQGGVEAYPHGGVYPEEVLVPWLEFTRDGEFVPLTIRATGHAPAGAKGDISLLIGNPNSVPVGLWKISLSCPAIDAELDSTIASLGRIELKLGTERWPTEEELRSAEGRLEWVLPGGERVTTKFTPALQSTEMYVRRDILGKLGGLE